jgi:hypothetical protein
VCEEVGGTRRGSERPETATKENVRFEKLWAPGVMTSKCEGEGGGARYNYEGEERRRRRKMKAKRGGRKRD